MHIALRAIIGGVVAFLFTFAVMTLTETSCKSPQVSKVEEKQPVDTVSPVITRSIGHGFDYKDIFYVIDPRVEECFAVHPKYGMSMVPCSNEIMKLAINVGDVYPN